MEARMSNPATILPDAMNGILTLLKATREGGVPQAVLELVHLRASQINGRSFCVDAGARSAKQAGETDERLFAVAAWREAPYFSDAERAALALTEAATRLVGRADPVPDSIWQEATRHYDEKQLAAIILMIATTNLFNRLNATTRQVAAGARGPQRHRSLLPRRSLLARRLWPRPKSYPPAAPRSASRAAASSPRCW
jgi:AhpD family alkylhydroperoxidase